jgi:hypothetical protein
MDFKPNPAVAAMFKMMGIDPQQIAQELGGTVMAVDNRVKGFEARLERIERMLEILIMNTKANPIALEDDSLVERLKLVAHFG